MRVAKVSARESTNKDLTTVDLPSVIAAIYGVTSTDETDE
jgi:hypothetical protein